MAGRFISFRVSEEDYELIEGIAEKSGKKPNEWCRKLVLSEAAEGSLMSGIERLLHEEIVCLRYLVGSGFGLLSAGTLSVEKWNEKVKEADKNPSGIARSLLDKRRANAQAK